jgi:hypothetical protein
MQRRSLVGEKPIKHYAASVMALMVAAMGRKQSDLIQRLVI